MDAIYDFDLAVFSWISEHLWNSILNTVMAVISFTGESGAIWIVFALVLLFFKKTRKTGIMMAVALIIMLVVNDNILKTVIARPRPYDYAGWTGFVYPEIAFRMPSSYSFPSGHTAAAFACATVAMMRDKRLGIPALVYAALMGFSRIYLFDHYCTDVLAGILAGALFGLVAYFLVEFIDKKRKASLEKKKQRQ